ncbi:DUF1080 domain-containing protein [Prolixibacteraceae bacterium JC049]|nr:DUF1080 domain-containing protein [Prolixibacteraceae bacterium JC049]
MNRFKNLLLICLLLISSATFAHWKPLFNSDLSNANFDKGVWYMKDGVLTANEDKVIWTKVPYENFILDLEFKTESGANSGVLVYCTDPKNWIPNSVEVQITDDFHPKWAKANKTWRCGAIFGHLAPTESKVKKPGQWNRYKITCQGQKIKVELNGKVVTEMDMSKWTSAKTNPDGTKIPSWLSTPFAELPTKGFIGLQGKHAGAKVFFRNMKLILLH